MLPHARFALVLLLVAAAAGGAWRAALIAAKRTLNHDEVISYLAAAGRQGDYDRASRALAAPLGTWVAAAEIKQMLRPQGACFGRVAADLAATDIHPPLYFWLLHAWCLLVGTQLWTGPALNAAVSVLTAFVLYVVARGACREPLTAMAAAAVWCLSPAVIETCFEARHYDLLGLWAVGLVGCVLHWAEARRVRVLRDGGLLALVTGAGLLTHYHFGLLVAACGLGLVWWLRGDRLRLMQAMSSLAAGAALFAVMNPAFMQCVARGRAQAQPFAWGDLLPRCKTIVLTYAGFVADTAASNWVVGRHSSTFLVLLVFAIAVIAVAAGRRRPASPRAGLLALLFVLMVASNAGLYIAGVSPRHAMGPQYLALVWPLLALSGAVALERCGRPAAPVAVACAAAMLVSGGLAVRHQSERWARKPVPEYLRSAPAVVVDTTARGILPCLAWHLDDDQLLLGAGAEYLTAHPELWVGVMQRGGVLITTELGAGDRRPALAALAGAAAEPRPGVFGLGRAWVCEPAAHAAAKSR